MSLTDTDARHDSPFADLEPLDEYLEWEAFQTRDVLLFPSDGRIERDAAAVFGLISQFDGFPMSVQIIAETFLWHTARVERALNRIEEALVEGHQRYPEFIDPMWLVRDPRRIHIDF